MAAKLEKKNFKFEVLLGQGSFGKVYLVRRHKDGKQFVIKQQEQNTNNASMNKMIKSEIECLQILRHPNIVSYYGAWQESDNFYMLLEYAACGTLKELMNKRIAPLSEKDSLYLFAQVVLGVHHIHSKKILHRDLKPENIMLTGRMGDIVKIGDFGLSREFHEDTSKSHAGSYYYISPEMLKKKPYDFKSDVWSMGVIFYEMLTNELAFPAESMREIIAMICDSKEQHGTLFAKSHGITRESKIIVYKMLQRDPEKRPSTKLLLLNPSLVSQIAVVYLNLGRMHAIKADVFGIDVFVPFFNKADDKA